MGDPNTAAPAAQPAAAPAVSPAPVARPAAPANPNAQSLAAQGGQADQVPGVKGPANPNPTAQGAAPTQKFPGRSSLVTNAQPTEVIEAEQDPQELDLPASTIAEMQAGKDALERNKPRSFAAAQAAAEKPRDADGRPLQPAKA